MLLEAVQQAKELGELYSTYRVDRSATRRCEKEFLWVSECFNLKGIEVFDLPRDIAEEAHLGAFIVTDTGFHILVRQDLDPAERRFVVCKEIFHIVLDQDEYRNMDIDGHVLNVLFNGSEKPPAHSVLVEFAAHAAAAEFLFPHAERIHHQASGTSLLKLAAMYDLPVDIVDFYMSDSLLEVLNPNGP